MAHGDLLRVTKSVEDRIPKAAKCRGLVQLTSGPGRDLRGVLATGWQEGLAATRREKQDFDWPEESLSDSISNEEDWNRKLFLSLSWTRRS